MGTPDVAALVSAPRALERWESGTNDDAASLWPKGTFLRQLARLAFHATDERADQGSIRPLLRHTARWAFQGRGTPGRPLQGRP
jgi:hypothetical protein